MELPEQAKRIVAEIVSHPKVVAVLLFGSWAQGTVTPLSDIDLAVVMDNPTFEEEAEVGSLYSPTVDVVLFHRLPLHIQFEVLRTGKEIFVQDEEKYFEVRWKVLHNYLEMAHFFQALVKEAYR